MPLSAIISVLLGICQLRLKQAVSLFRIQIITGETYYGEGGLIVVFPVLPILILSYLYRISKEV
jgi:hypothetical protein